MQDCENLKNIWYYNKNILSVIRKIAKDKFVLGERVYYDRD